MKKILFCIITLCSLCLPQFAVADGTYYVVRHAEKQDDSDDPVLTAAGLKRAGNIAAMLRDIKIDAIYSTDTNRTLMTATPTAAEKGIEVKIFSTDDLAGFAEMLKAKNGTFLIVAHSSSAPDTASLLSGQTVPKLDESDYTKLFKVVITGGDATLETLTTNNK